MKLTDKAKELILTGKAQKGFKGSINIKVLQHTECSTVFNVTLTDGQETLIDFGNPEVHKLETLTLEGLKCIVDYSLE